MSAITVRVFAVIAGVLLGLGGFILACQALMLALVNWLGPVGGLAAAAAILGLLAFAAFWFVRSPSKEVAEETEEAKAVAGDMLAGLPGEALAALIRKHPVKVILAALMLGYTMVRDPTRALRQAQSFVLALL